MRRRLSAGPHPARCFPGLAPPTLVQLLLLVARAQLRSFVLIGPDVDNRAHMQQLLTCALPVYSSP